MRISLLRCAKVTRARQITRRLDQRGTGFPPLEFSSGAGQPDLVLRERAPVEPHPQLASSMSC